MTETTPSNIAAALAAAQAEMGKALKQANNPHFRSKYADLGAVMDACLPALNKNGIALIQPTVDGDGGRYVKTVLLHASGETLECRVPLIVQKNDMQGYGSAVTYARRYGLMCMAGIAPEDDDGNAAAKAAPADYSAAKSADDVTERPRDQAREPDVKGAANHAQAALGSADTLERLQAIWADLPVGVKSLPEVIGTKDNRKAELQPKPQRAPDSADADEIPY
jgi:hypothetical protein